MGAWDIPLNQPYKILECRQPCLRNLHVMGIVSATDANPTDNASIGLNWIATAKNDQPIRFDDAMQ